MLGLELSASQVLAFERFEDGLYEANEVMNMTRVPKEEAWLRHYIDSLLFHDLIPENATVLDIGTGPGFPGWPLACARPDLQVLALDSSGKMIGFLFHHRLPNMKTLQVRAEEWHTFEAFDVVTGRALAPLGIQLELSARLTRVGGQIIPMRTPSELEEIRSDVSELGLELANLHKRALPGTEIVRLFPTYLKTAVTPKRYPRPWAEMRRKPVI